MHASSSLHKVGYPCSSMTRWGSQHALVQIFGCSTASRREIIDARILRLQHRRKLRCAVFVGSPGRRPRSGSAYHVVLVPWHGPALRTSLRQNHAPKWACRLPNERQDTLCMEHRRVSREGEGELGVWRKRVRKHFTGARPQLADAGSLWSFGVWQFS